MRVVQRACKMSATAPSPARSLVLLALFTVYIVWGSTYFALRVALESFPPFWLGGARFLVAGFVLLVALRARGVRLPTLVEWRAALMVGAVLFGFGNGGLALAQQLGMASSVAALVAATTPLFSGVFAWLFGMPPSGREWLGLSSGLVGVALMKAGGSIEVHGWAALLLLLSPSGWAFASLWSRRLPQSPGAMSNAGQMLGGGIALSLMALVRGEVWPAAPTLEGWLAALYLIIVGSLVGFVAYGFLLRHTRPTVAMSYAYVNPVVALVLGVGLGGEALSFTTGLGAAIVLASVVLITGFRRPA
jgi:drug/metabolite transporter (DMT)-like permease